MSSKNSKSLAGSGRQCNLSGPLWNFKESKLTWLPEKFNSLSWVKADRCLCLHPGSGVRITLATEILAESFTIYLPTLPGFDETPMLGGYTKMPDLALLIAEFVDVVIGGPVDVVAHSFGGWVASWLAVLRPDVVGSLVLQCPAGFRPEGKGGLEGSPAELLAKAYAHPEKRRPETKSPDITSANRKLVSIYSESAASDHELIRQLGSIQSNTLVLHGLKDGVIPEETPELLNRLIPKVTVIYVEDAAHNIEVDQPEEYAKLVNEFLVDGVGSIPFLQREISSGDQT